MSSITNGSLFLKRDSSSQFLLDDLRKEIKLKDDLLAEAEIRFIESDKNLVEAREQLAIVLCRLSELQESAWRNDQTTARIKELELKIHRYEQQDLNYSMKSPPDDKGEDQTKIEEFIKLQKQLETSEKDLRTTRGYNNILAERLNILDKCHADDRKYYQSRIEELEQQLFDQQTAEIEIAVKSSSLFLPKADKSVEDLNNQLESQRALLVSKDEEIHRLNSLIGQLQLQQQPLSEKQGKPSGFRFGLDRSDRNDDGESSQTSGSVTSEQSHRSHSPPSETTGVDYALIKGSYLNSNLMAKKRELELEAKLIRTTDRLKGTELCLAETEARCERIAGSLADTEAKLQESSIQSTQLVQELQTARQQLQDTQLQLQQTTSQLMETDDLVTALSSQLCEAEARDRRSSALLEEAQGRLRGASGSAEESERRMAALEAKVVAGQTEGFLRLEELRRFREQADELQNQIDRLKSRGELRERQLNLLKAELQEARAALDFTSEVAARTEHELQQRLEAAEGEVRQNRQRVLDAETAHATFLTHLDEKEAMASSLAEQLRLCREEICRLHGMESRVRDKDVQLQVLAEELDVYRNEGRSLGCSAENTLMSLATELESAQMEVVDLRAKLLKFETTHSDKHWSRSIFNPNP